MRKIIIGLLSIILVFSLASCENQAKKESVKKDIASEKVENKAEDKLSVDNNTKTSEDVNLDKKEETKTQEAPAKKEETKPQEVPAKKKIIVLDPGHSAKGNNGQEKLSPDSNTMKIKDPGGAQGIVSKTPEYVVAMKVAVKLKSLLEQNGFTVIMTKTEASENPGNIDRAEVGNKNNADLVVRIHCDSSNSQSAKGASMLFPAPVGYAKAINDVSKKYGQTILSDLVATAGMNNKGLVERNDLTGFNWSKVPTVLVEMGFMSNPQEDKLLNQDEYQNKLANGLCKGIIDSLN
ncbi:N-acetylmuramoyl-L-alanine amidase family protein [Clostridium folliculivorans]|uniref:N-acetylmuramoyl-L-alanine amidase n=1 Tax=Clostridium folliculivorans TaxID=2886038 RepID=A0A9W5XYE0_9CLOT|nr:N-acetylmuramoyl-L-alanine amidase [Clostridium folliculivorans]GKU23232.1 N-acetylmuramoyl-L-alanine amidase [Clostridium folliculivorans]GKU29349.1 N-acetylmuramoyl-L-alanine amidase [Clostridium folliculivorans]